MKALAALSTLLAALFSPLASADQCQLPSFIEEGRSYEFLIDENRQAARVLETDGQSCWIRISDRDWINLAHVSAIQDTTVDSLQQQNSPVGRWSCKFAATGKSLGNFTYAANGDLLISGEGSNRRGTWAISNDNTLSWRYEGGGGEDLDYWEISNGVMNITEGADKLTCNRIQ